MYALPFYELTDMLCDYNTEKQLGLKWVLVKNVRQSPNRAEIIFGLTRKPSPYPSCGCQDDCASHNTCTVDLSPVTAKKGQGKCLVLFGAPGGIRTRDLLIRSQALYPAELRAHIHLSTALYFEQLYYYIRCAPKSQAFFSIYC